MLEFLSQPPQISLNAQNGVSDMQKFKYLGDIKSEASYP